MTTTKFNDERVWFSVKFNLSDREFITELFIFENERIADFLPKDATIKNIVPIYRPSNKK